MTHLLAQFSLTCRSAAEETDDRTGLYRLRYTRWRLWPRGEIPFSGSSRRGVDGAPFS